MLNIWLSTKHPRILLVCRRPPSPITNGHQPTRVGHLQKHWKRAPAPTPAAAHSSQDGHINPLPTDSDESEFSASEDDTACDVCGMTSSAPVMLLCDTCDHGFHLYCLSPPLPRVPSGQWLCSKCTIACAPSQLRMRAHRMQGVWTTLALSVLPSVTCPPRVWPPEIPTIAPLHLSPVGSPPLPFPIRFPALPGDHAS